MLIGRLRELEKVNLTISYRCVDKGIVRLCFYVAHAA
jgi:hypothetical protein